MPSLRRQKLTFKSGVGVTRWAKLSAAPQITPIQCGKAKQNDKKATQLLDSEIDRALASVVTELPNVPHRLHSAGCPVARERCCVHGGTVSNTLQIRVRQWRPAPNCIDSVQGFQPHKL